MTPEFPDDWFNRISALVKEAFPEHADEILERLKKLNEKIDRIEAKLKGLDDMVSSGGMSLQPRTISVKTKEAIKLILQKYGKVTPSQLSKLIKLSRTRCNEYLKGMENEGIAISIIDCRKKFYSIRQ